MTNPNSSCTLRGEVSIADTYFYLLENPSQRQLGLCGSRVAYETPIFDKSIYQQARGREFETRREAYLDWLIHGRRDGLDYARGRNTVLKIMVKAKDEPELMEKWITHHAAIVGFENLIIMDCGSSDPDYLEVLNKYRFKVLIFSYRKYYDFLHATNSNTPLFELVRNNCKYLTILDADEFLCQYSGGMLSSLGIVEFLASSNTRVFAGSWIWNSRPPATDFGRINWDVPISFAISHSEIRAGTISGKSIASSAAVFEIKHLGHNLHVKEVVDEMVPESFGHFFVLHLASLETGIVERRLLKHLKAKGVVPVSMSQRAEVCEFLESGVDALPTHAAGYVKKYLALEDDKYPARDDCFDTYILSGKVMREPAPPLFSSVVNEFHFDGLLQSHRSILRGALR